MSTQGLKIGDKVECTGIFFHEYLEDESFYEATGTIIKKVEDEVGMWVVEFDKPQFALDKEGYDTGPYYTFRMVEEELEKVGETDDQRGGNNEY